jgi:hypothetical protein
MDAPFAEPAGVVEDALALYSLPEKELVRTKLGEPARRAMREEGRRDRVPEGLASVRPQPFRAVVALVVEGALLAECALKRRLSHPPSQ